jgi:hypothetical protein
LLIVSATTPMHGKAKVSISSTIMELLNIFLAPSLEGRLVGPAAG